MNEKELYMKYKKKYLELKGGFIKNRNAIKIDIIRHKQCDNNDIVKFSPNFLKTLSDIHVTELSPVGDGEDKRRKKKEEDKKKMTEGELEEDLGLDMFDEDDADEEDDDDDTDDGEEEDDDDAEKKEGADDAKKKKDADDAEKKEGVVDAKKKKGADEIEEDLEEVEELGKKIEQLQAEIG